MGWLGAQVVPSIDGVAYGLLLFLVAGGLTLAYGVGRVLNLAHGAVCAAGAYTAAVLCDGTWLSLASVIAAERMALAGFDWLTIDLEHAPTNWETALAMVAVVGAQGCAPWVRIPSSSDENIKRALDAELYFYSRVFNFQPADAIEPVPIANLE